MYIDNSIAGIQLTTLLDYPGEVASIVFMKGCNMQCGFCHNSKIASSVYPSGGFKIKEIVDKLVSRKSNIDHVVISGGEPTIHDEQLFDLLNTLKDKGFKIKLDTNGTRPSYLERLLYYKKIDFIAMDIKAPLISSKYSEVTGTFISEWMINEIRKSIDIIKDSDIDYEFRTTVVKDYHDISDLIEIASMDLGNLFFQQFNQQADIFKPGLSQYTNDELKEMVDEVKKRYPYVKLRGI